MSAGDPKIKRAGLLVTTVSYFMIPFMASSVNVALPAIGREFEIDVVLLSWVTSSYLLAASVFIIPLGRLSDIYGRKRMFQYGIFFYFLSSLLLAVANSAGLLIFFRILQGIAGATPLGIGVAMVTSVFPPEERGKALGIVTAGAYLGLSLGPFLGGLLTQYFGWRSVFISVLPLCVIILILIRLGLKGEWAEARGEKVDVPGSLLCGVTLVAFIYGFSRLPGMSGAWLLLAGILSLFAFIKWEMKAESPVLNVWLFRENRVFAFSNLSTLINYSATYAVGFLLSLYLQYAKGLRPEEAGVVLVAQPLIQTIFSPLAGRLSDRIEPRLVASLGMALTVVGLFLLTLLSEATGLSYIVLTLVVLGFGFALFSSPNTNAVMGSVEKKFYGVASATLGTMRLTGQMLSMGIVMMIFSIFVGRVQITSQSHLSFLTSLKVAFGVFAVLCLGGIFASLPRGRIAGATHS